MAHTRSDQPLLSGSRTGQALWVLPRQTAHIWALFSLVLLTLAAFIIVSFFRTGIAIDVGDYYDSAFVQQFHDREVDGDGARQSWPWPVDQRELVVPGGLQGNWLITVHAAEDVPGRPLDRIDLVVNDVQLASPHDEERFFSAFVPVDIASADTLVLRLVPDLSGGLEPPTGLVGSVSLEPARTYRWSRGESSITLPGLGSGAWQLSLDLVTMHPDQQPLDARISANGVVLAHIPNYPELRRVHVLVPASLMQSGDLALTLSANTFEDPRPLGILVSGLRVQPVTSAALLLPPWAMLGATLVLVIGLYGSLALLQPYAAAVAAARWYRWLAWGISVLILALVVWGLLAYRFPTTFMLPGLALLMLWSLVLILVLRPLLRWAFATAGVPVQTTSTAPDLLQLLILIFVAGYWIKTAGMLYPYFIGIDVAWHMDRVRWILDGQLPLLYGVDSPMNESTMPEAEWGPNRPVIPYSPYFHIFATVFALLPWSLEFSANLFSALIDCSHVLIIGLLARKGGLSPRGALLAALLYAVLPANFLLHSWGNLPTTSGLWWTFVTTAFVVIGWQKLHQAGPFLILTLLLLVSLLVYTVSGAFMGLFLLLFTLAIALVLWQQKRLNRHEGDHIRVLTRGLIALWLATLSALILSLLIYYGQYLLPIIERTIPYFAEALTADHEDMGRTGDTLPDYALRHTRLTLYGLVIPIGLSIIYVIWQWLRGSQRLVPTQEERGASEPLHAWLLWAAIAGWLGVMLLFIPLAYKISMVDKHFFVTMPLLCIASAALIDYSWSWGWAARGPRWSTIFIWGSLR
ncbi:MAG: hypothetical protein HC837_07355 [Chloroflexaceae bacterium]|nr:hypothetical protein [Chloroflexaceae bacterium]